MSVSQTLSPESNRLAQMSYTALTMHFYSSLPVALCASKPIFTPLSRYSTTLTKSASLKLRDVKAGTPVKQRTMSDHHSTSPHSITTL